MGRLSLSFLAAAVLAGAVSPITHAADESFNSAALGLYQDPGFGVNREMSGANGSDTVDPFMGALKAVVKDLVIPGNNGLNIEVVRNYQSVTNTSGPYSNGHTARTPFGTGWDINFGRLWVSTTYRYLNQGSTNVACQIGQVSTNLNPILELPDGSRQTLANGDGSDTAFITKDRWIGRCLPTASNTGDGGLIVFSPQGLKYTFNLVGTVSPDFQLRTYFVTRIEDPAGNYLNFTYSKNSTNVYGYHHVLTGITASDGRTVTFNYSGLDTNQTLLTSITGAGKTVTYTYTNAAYAVGAKAQYLTKVAYTDGTNWAYTYQDTNLLTGTLPGRFSMLSMQSPLGLKTTYTYAYQQMGSDPAEKLNVIASRTLSGIRGSTAASQAWTYTYTKGYSPNNDTTLENGPTQCVRYTHVGANTIANGASGVDQGLWKIGLLLKKETLAKSGTACGAVVRTETNTWGSQNVSDQNEVRRYNLLSENYTRAPILTEKVINQDGVDYTTDYTYDTYGQPLTVTETGQKSRTTTLTYTRPGNLWMMGKVATQAVSGVSGNLSNTYNTLGQLTQASKYGVISKYTYLSSGDLATVTDANNHVTTYSDYYRGVPRSVKFADGGVMTRTVNATGTVATSVDPLKRTTSYTYDSMDRLSKVTPPKGSTSATTIAYAFSTSNVTQTVKRGGYTRLREFNQLGQLIKQTESGTSLKSILSTATYTPDGQKSFVSIPNYTSASTVGETYTYDTLGRMLKDTHGDGTSISASYPSGSNSVVSTDERGNATTTVYAAYGDPAARQITSITQPGNVVSTIVTDNLGRVTSNSQGGLSRTYAYNASGFLGSETNPETGTTTYGYDAVGNLKSKQVGASAIDSYAYDAADRLLSINFGGTTPLTNSYDVGGRLLTQDFAGTHWSYGYDTHDKLTAETLTLTSPAKSYTFGYAYDAVDSLSSITYPSGRVVAYTPDAFGHSTQAGTYATGITYAANGAVLGLNYGNGRALAVTQDAKRLRTLSRTVAGSDMAMKLTYGYDGASNLTSITDGQNTAASQTLGYDALNRLTSATGLWGTATYTYNTRGDLTSQAGIRALTYTYDNQGRLSALSGDITSTLAYDTQGRVLSARGNYNYDAAGDLVSLCLQVRSDCATTPDQSFAYDARGKRVTQAFGSGKAVVDVYGYQGKLLLEETTPAGGAASANEYVYAANELVAEVASAGATYHHNDHLGSPVAATNAQGTLLWTSHFQPYGDRQEKGQAATVGSVGYTGHVQDDESGLVYAGARFYDPLIGRFLSLDLVGARPGVPSSFNRYAYANNNPHGYVDPDGNTPIDTLKILIPQLAQAVAVEAAYAVGTVTGNDALTATAAEAAEEMQAQNLGSLVEGAAAFAAPPGASAVAAELEEASHAQTKTPRDIRDLKGGPLENASRHSGHFDLEQGPKNGTLYRADPKGNITSYAVYDAEGKILKRVDVTGAAHLGVDTPHVVEYGRNKLPDGSVRVQSPSTKSAPRPATSDEIP